MTSDRRGAPLPCAVFLTTLAFPALAESSLDVTDSFIMGAGRWPCSQLLDVAASRAPLDLGQAAGWVLGAWSRATTEREKRFTDIVENVGGTRIFEATVEECRKAPPSTPLYRVVYRMIDSTNPGRE